MSNLNKKCINIQSINTLFCLGCFFHQRDFFKDCKIALLGETIPKSRFSLLTRRSQRSLKIFGKTVLTILRKGQF